MMLTNKNFIETIVFIKKVCWIEWKLEFWNNENLKIFFDRDWDWTDFIPSDQLDPEVILFNSRVNEIISSSNTCDLRKEFWDDEYNYLSERIRDSYDRIFDEL